MNKTKRRFSFSDRTNFILLPNMEYLIDFSEIFNFLVRLNILLEKLHIFSMAVFMINIKNSKFKSH